MDSLDARDRLLRRWPVVAIALLILLLGSLPGIVREAELWRSLQASGSNADTPYFGKREPLRALAALERKDGQGSQWLSSDGILIPTTIELDAPDYIRSLTNDFGAPALHLPFWPGPLPRAPPPAA
ncbi:hypothetical protein EPK99_07200 [Neorhizobium lilium]|uniref:Uncharacterized protein n=1 Tax=Neorhizobium lilium TaxID=2503024 RepID=A0A3S3VK08_9HYPH|nr:hypothetical protein [Neorhizobium lilium]RWX78399.1 hypothetical protein EPK99_07200 [Neorhizobium lilium]